MNQEEFKLNLRQYYPKINPAHLEKICEIVEHNTDEERKSMLDTFVVEYKLVSSPPQVSHFEDIMKDQGKVIQRERPTVYAYRCAECGGLYAGSVSPHDVYKSPCCGGYSSHDRLIKNPHGKIQLIQSICAFGWNGYIQDKGEKNGSCPRYNPSAPISSGAQCSSFGNYGILTNCSKCLCRDCCGEYSKEQDHLKAVMEK